jgi:hypothetical protein
MSPSTERRKRTARRHAHFVRPAEAPVNHPIPWRGWDVRQACPLRPSIVYQALMSLKPVPLPPGHDGSPRGWIVTNTSNVRVKQATVKYMPSMTSSLAAEPMALRTVGHSIDHLVQKGFIERWDCDARARHSPYGTSYRILPWDEVLQRWAHDPNIATATGTRRGFYVWGKGRWHLSPADVAEWQIDEAAAEANPDAHAGAIALPETAGPAVTQETAAEPETPAVAAMTRTAPPVPEPDLNPLLDALLDVCGAADIHDARRIMREIAKASGKREAPGVEDAARFVRAVGHERGKVGNRNPINTELMRRKMSARVEAWQKGRREYLAQQAKAAQWAREDRINQLTGYLRDLDRADLPPPDRVMLAEILATADPAERDDAQKLLDRANARTA